MWHKLKHVFLSLKTYRALSPDLHLRRQVNRSLKHRPTLSLDLWVRPLYLLGISRPVAQFAFTALGDYSGLNMGKTMASDRLEADLLWTQICWFDWEINLINDFRQEFQVDISDRLYNTSLTTLGDLLVFLEQQLPGPHESSDGSSHPRSNIRPTH